jgi:predicted nucleic acid-binding Zn ribbon protein
MSGHRCVTCGSTFTPARRDARYCGERCRQRACRQRARDQRNLDWCDTLALLPQHEYDALVRKVRAIPIEVLELVTVAA